MGGRKQHKDALQAEIDKVFAALVGTMAVNRNLVKRIPVTLFAFKKGDHYTFRLPPGSRAPYYVDGLMLVDDFRVGEGETGDGVTIGTLETTLFSGVLVSSLHDATAAFGGMAVALHRSLQIAKAEQQQQEAASAKEPSADPVVDTAEAPPDLAG